MPHFRDPGFKASLYFTKRKIVKSLPRSLRGQSGGKKSSSNCHFYASSGKEKKKKGKCLCKSNHLKRVKVKLLTFVLSHLISVLVSLG